MVRSVRTLALLATSTLLTVGLVHCSSSNDANGSSNTVSCSSLGADAAATTSQDTCYSDNDGINDDTYTIAIAVDDTGFTSAGGDDAGTKNIIATQNESQVTLTLTNNGTKLHGFQVGCVNVCSSYPTLPAGCFVRSVLPQHGDDPPHRPRRHDDDHVRYAEARWSHLSVLVERAVGWNHPGVESGAVELDVRVG